MTREGKAATGRWNSSLWLLALVPVTLAALVYYNTLDNPFVYDDFLTVVENPSLRDSSNWQRLLLHMRFRPLVNLSLAADFRSSQLETYAYHRTALLLHMANCLLVFLVARKLIEDAWTRLGAERSASNANLSALMVGCVFAVHPLSTQAVGYISARADLLSGFFVLSSFLILRRWLLRPGPGTLTAGLVCFVLGLASKETAAALPLALLLWDWLLGPQRGEHRDNGSRPLSDLGWRLHLPLLAVVALGGGYRLYTLMTVETGLLPRTISENLISQSVVIWRYLSLFLAPLNQSIVHPAQTISDLLDLRVLLAVTALAVTLAFAVRFRRRFPLSTFGTLWFFLLLAPSSSLVPLNELMAEHRVYLASLGLCLIAIDLAERVYTRVATTRARQAATVVALVVMIAGLGAATLVRNHLWSDPPALWYDATVKAPKTFAAYFFLGEALRNQDRHEEAVHAFEAATSIAPGEAEAYARLGSSLAHLDRLDEAETIFQRLLTLAPGSPRPYNDLGRLAATQGRFDQARSYFEAALERDEQSQDALYNLGLLYERVYQNPAEALRYCRAARYTSPDPIPPVEQCIRRNGGE